MSRSVQYQGTAAMPPMRNRTTTHALRSHQKMRLTRPDWPQHGLSSEMISPYIRRVQYTVLSVAGLKGTMAQAELHFLHARFQGILVGIPIGARFPDIPQTYRKGQIDWEFSCSLDWYGRRSSPCTRRSDRVHRIAPRPIRRAPRTPIPLRREAGLQPTCSRPMRRSNRRSPRDDPRPWTTERNGRLLAQTGRGGHLGLAIQNPFVRVTG